MANCLLTIALWTFLTLALAPSPVASEDGKPFDSSIPQPKVISTNPKSSLVQLSYYHEGNSEESMTFEVNIRDPNLQEFKCVNKDYETLGSCTLSGLSPSTTYNITVRDCSPSGCGLPTVLYITTRPESRIYFGTIFVIFVVLIVLAFIGLNYDLVCEVLQPCVQKLRARISRGNHDPNSSSGQAAAPVLEESGSDPNDIPLTSMASRPRQDGHENEAGPSAESAPPNPATHTVEIEEIVRPPPKESNGEISTVMESEAKSDHLEESRSSTQL